MTRAIAILAIVCTLALMLGGLSEAKKDRLSVTALSEKKLVTVIVTLHDVTPDYRWLSVYGCSAEITETGTACNYFWERESSYELQNASKQQLVFWRGLPGGTMQIQAVAFDAARKPLARGSTTIFRSQ